jgi:hypothetical protein
VSSHSWTRTQYFRNQTFVSPRNLRAKSVLMAVSKKIEAINVKPNQSLLSHNYYAPKTISPPPNLAPTPAPKPAFKIWTVPGPLANTIATPLQIPEFLCFPFPPPAPVLTAGAFEICKRSVFFTTYFWWSIKYMRCWRGPRYLSSMRIRLSQKGSTQTLFFAAAGRGRNEICAVVYIGDCGLTTVSEGLRFPDSSNQEAR